MGAKRVLAMGVLAAAGFGTAAQAAERAEVPAKYTWNLADLYASDADWAAAKDKLIRRLPELASLRGHLGDSPEALLKAARTLSDLNQELQRLYAFANQKRDEDTRVSANTEKLQAMERLAVDLGAASSWVAPELLALDPAKVQAFLARPELKEFKFYIEDILRRRPHTLSAAEEAVAAEAGNLVDTGASVHSMFTDADLPYPEVKLSDGRKVRLDAQNYTRYRAAVNRDDRLKVFKAFWGEYAKYTRTLGLTLYSQVKSHVFDKRVHKHGSSLEAALFADNIPPAVYRQLIADVHRHLPTLHRYLALRQRMLGLKDLRYEDLYTPVVKKAEATYTPEQGMDMTLRAVAPLGPDYVAALKHAFDNRWTDWLPSTGKRSGAYSGGAYGAHPYQLLNFMGQYDDVSTLAHESGHTMHSHLAMKAQPFVTSNYSIFVAEVASTLNENLLLHDSLAGAKDDDLRLSLLGSYLDGLRQTLYRQTLFAEFELAIHELAEKGETLTGDNMTALYLKLLREYYGHDKGVCVVDDLYGVEWAYIPHFYYNFYVYKYATSLVASLSIAKAIREQAAATPPATAARDAYLKMLAAGGSKYPMQLLRDAGVDMSTSAPFDAAMAETNKVMDEMEALLAKKPGKPVPAKGKK